jgi:hypothetical protein
MSGGYFEYIDSRLKDEIFGWTDRCCNALEDHELSELVWDVLNLLHDFDYYKSGDTCKETYLEEKRKFKKKWFGKRESRVREIIDETIERTREELYETFLLEDEGEKE